LIGTLATARRALYALGAIRSDSLPRPVVSIGNLTVGGSGKTPHVMFVASWLTGRGVKVAVLSRGYGRRSRGVVWVSHGEGPVVPASVGGDEPVLLAASLPGVPVLVAESRSEAGRECLRRREVDAFLLDDGYQHLSLRRDADILLVDAVRGLGNRRTLPFGPLREPPRSARFADALIVTRCGGLAEGEAVADGIPFPVDRPRAFTRLVPRSLVDRAGRETPLPTAAEEVTAFSGLARNDQFCDTLRGAGYVVRKFVGFGDHHAYRARDIERILAAAGGMPVMTTEKDLVRLPADLAFEVKALRVGVEFLAGWEAVSGLVLGSLARPWRS
jgi:tetraacyldisaccharide 4'-kinase